MQKKVFDRILAQIAQVNQVSVSELREKMQSAMADALVNPDPTVQAMWNRVPKKGNEPTLEEFMDYLVEKNMLIS